jgi:hypothetical protein
MGKHNDERKLKYPWRNLHSAVWLFGLAYLFISGNWWPGILFLVAASMLLEGVLALVAPHAFEEMPSAPTDEKTRPPAAPVRPVSSVTINQPTVPYRADLLPTNCPRCGAPARGHEVKWTSPTSADCAFCGANLPMK